MNNLNIKIKGFTLVEMLLVITIMGLLASIIVINVNNARDEGKIAKVISDAWALNIALMYYYDDMGFFPPEVDRGWDPGLVYMFPNNPDTGKTNRNVDCDHCPPNWVSIVRKNWNGPYLATWPRLTPWQGKYDYNYWGSWTSPYGCYVPAGIYVGAERDYDEQNPVSIYAEQTMVNRGYDDDSCVNGEAQMMLLSL